MSKADDKVRLRGEIKRRIAALCDEEIAAQSYTACKRAEKLTAFKNAGTILAYMAMRGECDPAELVRAAAELGKTVAYPVCGENKSLELYVPKNDGCFICGAYGIAEPDRKRSRKVSEAEVDLIIVPGLAFDTKLNRLGRGGGYYDRLLQRTSAFKLGLALSCQLLEDIPTEEHDAKMDVVSSEFGIYC